MIYYLRSPELDGEDLINNYCKTKRGLFFFFRHMCIAMQSHFADLMNLKEVPKVFLHGNPHLENYSITENGAGLVDFDRSRIGPYTWDVLRFLSSLSLKRDEKRVPFLSSIVLEYFKEGYLRGIKRYEEPFKEITQAIGKANLAVWYDQTHDYLEDNGKWVREMEKEPVKIDNKDLVKKLDKYLNTTSEPDLLERYQVVRAGYATGTFGNSRIVILLKSKNGIDDHILIEIKETYTDPDNKHFFSPVNHHGLRMIQASELYAPGLEQRIGHLTHNGKELWGREIITKHGKIKGLLNEFEQVDVAYSVGTQLGRAHRLSLQEDVKPKQLTNHFLDNFENLIGASVMINSDLISAYEAYINKLNKVK